MKAKKGYRIFGISVGDILTLILIGILITVGMKFSAPLTANAKDGDVKVTYTVELNRKDTGFADKINTGQVLYDSQKGFQIGVITSAYEAPYYEDIWDFENNVFKRAAIDGLSYVYVTVEANAQMSDAAIAVGQYELQVGKEVFIKSKDFASIGYIVIIEVND